MIDKWLKAGTVEDGVLRHTTEGSPQGGVISPCLSNVFLHHVLDEWFESEVRPRLRGDCTFVRRQAISTNLSTWPFGWEESPRDLDLGVRSQLFAGFLPLS
jgi:retron-type reverse transcriptase